MSSPQDPNVAIIEEFRVNAGRVGGDFEGAPLLLLHSTGARTGQERVNPVMYRRVGETYAVFGSKAGAPTNPDWYHNVRAHPQVTIEVGGDTVQATARVAEGEERSRIWEEQKAEFPLFAVYDRGTTREIPVVILHPEA
ncbi:MAG: nitroreductase family deazaflavin-dependent oxidoreductase [Pseudonocardiales bacterium]